MKSRIMFFLVFIGCLCVQAQAKININTASAEELAELPRIGEGLAKSIIDFREVHGPFKSIEDIQNVPRIGDQTFRQIKDLIYVGGESTVPVKSVPKSPDLTQPVDAMVPISKEIPIPTASPTPEPSVEEILNHFKFEPSIAEVQKAALRFAEIDPARFASWRRNAKLKALVPDSMQVTMGHDTDDDTDYSRSKSISLSGGTVTIGPDDETWGHDTDDDWDYELKLRWNLQDYLFNPDMLRVSAETEDQIGLRQNILNDITKLFFDRRRLQIDILLSPARDIQARMKNMLRLEELTAIIDGMTDGYFSSEINRRQGESSSEEVVEQ